MNVAPYRAVLVARYLSLLQYRGAALAGIGTQVFWGVVRTMIFVALYRSADHPPPISLADTITYLWLIQAFYMVLPWHIDPEVEAMVRSGNVAYELVKPVDLHAMWLVRAIALRAAPISLRCGPILLIAPVLFGMRAPASWESGACFLIGLGGAVLLGSSITVLLMVSSLWTLSSRGFVRLTMALVNLLSGALVPLPLFPDWVQDALALLPFRGLLDTPFRLYLGHLSGVSAAAALAHQLAWFSALSLLARLLLAQAERRIVVQGG